jgi:hypothetical protein
MPFMYTPRPSNDGVDVETSSTTRDMSETVIYPGLSSIRSVLLICTVASAGFLTVRQQYSSSTMVKLLMYMQRFFVSNPWSSSSHQ